MFEASINASLFRDSIDTISQIIGEGDIKITQDGLKLEAVDRSMVAFVNLHIAKEAFESFKSEGNDSMGVNLENLMSMMKRVKGNDIMIMSLKDNKLLISIDGDYTRKFSVPLIEIPSGEKIDIDKLSPPAKLQLKSSFMENGVSDASIVSDHIILEADADHFSMRSQGNGSDVEVKAEKGKAAISIDSAESVKSSFSLDYLKKILKGSKISDVVNLELGKDYPVKIEFTQPEKVRLSFVLAPRIEE